MSQVAELRNLVASQEKEISYLREQLAALKKALFGPRSEKIQSDHPQLPFLGMDEVHEPEEVVVADDEGARPKRERRKTPHGRKPLPAHLPRERVEHHPPKEDCTCKCGDAMKPCDETMRRGHHRGAGIHSCIFSRERTCAYSLCVSQVSRKASAACRSSSSD